MKVVHMRKKETKELILNRKALQEEAAKTKCKELKKESNQLYKEVNKAVIEDEEEFYRKGFEDGEDSSKVWRTANDMLGTVKNLSPSAIVHQTK